jgi:hypothetical protein
MYMVYFIAYPSKQWPAIRSSGLIGKTCRLINGQTFHFDIGRTSAQM